jgi:hypothetical protein
VLFRPKHYARDVAIELANGLRDGSIVLERHENDSTASRALLERLPAASELSFSQDQGYLLLISKGPDEAPAQITLDTFAARLQQELDLLNAELEELKTIQKATEHLLQREPENRPAPKWNETELNEIKLLFEKLEQRFRNSLSTLAQPHSPAPSSQSQK